MQIKAKIDEFIADEAAKQVKFKPMEKIFRGIV